MSDAIEKIKQIVEDLQGYKELLIQLQDMETIYCGLDWLDVHQPHHIEMELAEAINEVENKINEIEIKLERL